MNPQVAVSPLSQAQQQANRQFFQLLQQSQLLDADLLALIQEQLEREPLKEVANYLLKREQLTRWQMQRLLKGHHAFRIGRYTLIDYLGGGGMGDVFKARQDGLGRVVALKVMRASDNLEGEWAARFQREIYHASRLQHPNIVTVVDAECIAGRYILVMEYVKGPDLGRLLSRFGRFPIPAACEYVRQAALGLQHAHDQGLVHRDIKPANLLLTREELTQRPLIKLLDLGLARQATPNAEVPPEQMLTGAGLVFGTVDYMAPEQARDFRAAEFRSDIFSLSITLFHLLTGEVPFKGNSATERLVARVLEDAPDVRTFRPMIPEELAWLIARGLAREPEHRIPTASQLATELEPFTQLHPDLGNEMTEHTTEVNAAISLSTISHSVSKIRSSSDMTQPLRSSVNERTQLQIERDEILAFLEESQVQPTFTSDVVKKTSVAPKPSASASVAWLWWFMGIAVVLLLSGLAWFIQSSLSPSGQVTALEVRWQEEELQSIFMAIDGKPVPLTKLKRFRWELQPGKHSLLMRRPGYEALEINLDLQPGQVFTYQPEWQPEQIRVPLWQQPTPVDQKFIQAIQKLPPQDQVAAVISKLRVLNIGYDGQYEMELRREGVFSLSIRSVWLTDLSPLKALPTLKYLNLAIPQPTLAISPLISKLADISPLRDLQLAWLDISYSQVQDLVPLQKMPLECLRMIETRVTDLTPLNQLRLSELHCPQNMDLNLEPLRNNPLIIYSGPVHTQAQRSVLASISTLKKINEKPASEVLQADHTK